MAVEAAVETFITTGRSIARESSCEVEQELLDCLKEVEGAGQELTRRAIHFTVSPLEDGLRGDMMEAARTLLSCVTKLLLLADFVDVKKILDRAGDTETSLGQISRAESSRELMKSLRKFESCLRYSTVQYSTEEYSTEEYSTVQYSSVQYNLSGTCWRGRADARMTS